VLNTHARAGEPWDGEACNARRGARHAARLVQSLSSLVNVDRRLEPVAILGPFCIECRPPWRQGSRALCRYVLSLLALISSGALSDGVSGGRLGSLENVAKWEYEKRAIERLRERESKVARALDRAQLYADEYPSGALIFPFCNPVFRSTPPPRRRARMLCKIGSFLVCGISCIQGLSPGAQRDKPGFGCELCRRLCVHRGAHWYKWG